MEELAGKIQAAIDDIANRYMGIVDSISKAAIKPNQETLIRLREQYLYEVNPYCELLARVKSMMPITFIVDEKTTLMVNSGSIPE